MDIMWIVIFFIGAVSGSVITYFLLKSPLQTGKNLSENIDLIIKIANEKLSSERLLSSKDLENKKEQIDTGLANLNNELKKVSELVTTLEQKRGMQVTELRTIIDNSTRETRQLAEIANNLQNTLSSKQSRGIWAERMANDVLNYAGMVEGINYIKQQRTTTDSRPDFTFLLPNKMKLNMDVKFPLESYARYINADETTKQKYQQEFISSIKKHIKDLTSRQYINPEDNTIDSVLMFIPNEKIYSTIFDIDDTLLNCAIDNRVLICSPVTIISILAIIRQAADNFVLEQRAKELLIAMGGFRKEWLKYIESFDKLGEHINKVSEKYNELRTTRGNKLDISIRRLDDLKTRDVIDSEE